MIKLIITDFDGTLADTFEANYKAYREVLSGHGVILTPEKYRECFGLRFDNFMHCLGIEDATLKKEIKIAKGELYPNYFEFIKVNSPLLEFIRAFRRNGGLTAIASTARGVNLKNALIHIGAENDFDFIVAGEMVRHGKPDPEIFNTVLELAGVSMSSVLIFEDSEVGCKAAEIAGINYIRVNNKFFNE